MCSTMQTVLFALCTFFAMAHASLAGEVSSKRCAPPPVTTAEQAVCLVRLEVPEWKELKAEAFQHDQSCWVVEFIDPRPDVLGGGGQITLDADSGKVTRRLGYQ
jgi:hypothetical protein